MKGMKRDRLKWLTARPIAHRGYHDIARGRPENSIAAFEAAVKARYAIECDLHLAADSVPVVFHDADLQRLTGAPGCVRDLTSAELGDLRIAGTSEWIPTFEELLDLVEGRVPLVIELKHMDERDAGLAWQVAERLKRYPGSAAAMSFDAALIADLKAADPHMPRGLIAAGDWRRGVAHLRTALRLGVDFISYAIDDLPTLMPILARELLRIPLICWTVQTPVQWRKARTWTDQMTFEGFAP
jgi:glycerophosphoryl diester phosphodiesterase